MRLIGEGEHEQQDFKFAISDARKIARSISAFANNSGGRLLIGVKDNGAVAGIRSEEDVCLVEQAAEMYCRPAQKIEATAYAMKGGAVVVSIAVASAQRRPVRVVEEAGRLQAYFRVADENISVPEWVERVWRGPRSRSLSLDGPDTALMRLLGNGESLGFDDIARLLHITAGDAAEAIARVVALDLARLVHRPDGFRLELTPDFADAADNRDL